MADPEQLAKLNEGVTEWNRWRKFESKREVDLSGANLCMAHLKGAALYSLNLSGANLTSAKLHGADFSYTNLEGANLVNAKLDNAEFSGSILRRAQLSHSHLQRTRFIRANLDGADLSDAILQNTIFSDTNLGSAIGLDACIHKGPSILDHSTIARSWPVPISFLRGCGLPESFITYLPSLLNQPIQFYSCFISYSTQDQPFADRLYADLQNKGVRCWFAPHDMAPGQKIHEQIDEAIRLHDKLLLILSEHSMNSEWVKTEIRKARKREVTDNRRMLFPVSLVGFQPLKEWECFDAEIGKDAAVEIREFFIPDFSTWKTNHDAYQENFDRLVKSLQTKEPQFAASAHR